MLSELFINYQVFQRNEHAKAILYVFFYFPPRTSEQKKNDAGLALPSVDFQDSGHCDQSLIRHITTKISKNKLTHVCQ